MRAHIAAVIASILDALLPPRTSEHIVRGLTPKELESLAATSEEALSLPYRDPRTSALVWECKYHANSRALALAGAFLADALTDAASDCVGIPLLIPVPMHPARRRERGHNHTELLCEAALSVLERGNTAVFLEYAPNILLRTRHTPPQQGLAKTARLINMQGSMEVGDRGSVVGRTCIVLDDVTTTGATAAEATRALAEAGAARTICIALAHS